MENQSAILSTETFMNPPGSTWSKSSLVYTKTHTHTHTQRKSTRHALVLMAVSWWHKTSLECTINVFIFEGWHIVYNLVIHRGVIRNDKICIPHFSILAAEHGTNYFKRSILNWQHFLLWFFPFLSHSPPLSPSPPVSIRFWRRSGI